MSPWKCRFVTDGGGFCLKPWWTHDISGSHWKPGNDTYKEPRNRGKKGGNPFVPVTPLALMCSQRHGLCGKLNPCSPVMFEGDRWVVFLRIYWCIFLRFVFVCVVQCIRSLLSLFDGLIWVPLCRQRGFCSEWSHWHQLPCGWSETICSRRILNALQQWRVWHTLNRAYVASIDFHIWEHLYYCWSPIRAQRAAQGLGLLEHSWSSWLTDRLPALWARSYADCLERHHSGWDYTSLDMWQNTDTGGFPAPRPLIQSSYK